MASGIIHVILSQGYQTFFGKYKMQPWVENINKILEERGFNIYVFTAGEVSQTYIKDGVKVSISKRLSMLSDPFSLDLTLRLFLVRKPSFAIIHGLQHILTLFSLIVYSIRNVPVVILVHGLYVHSKITKLLCLRDLIIRNILLTTRTPYILIALTNYDKSLLLNEWKIPKDKVKISKVPLYLTKEELKLIEQIKKRYFEYIMAESTKVRFLYIGRIVYEQKRIDRLIKIFYQFLKKGGANAELIIAGEGPLKQPLLGLIKKLRINEFVKIKGAISEKEKWLLYLTSTALVLTSDFEGLPRTIFEAFSSGKIVIVPNICGLNEIVHNGINGFIFNNDEHLLMLLNLVAANKQLMLRMGYNNYELANKQFILETNKEDILSCLRILKIEC
ncbi:MAG: glycosyltransferase family 4 protein [Nitrososphaeria archaeon]